MNLEITNLDTGEIISKEDLSNMIRKEKSREIKEVYQKLEKEPNNVTLDELELVFNKRKDIQLDFSEDGYFMVKRNENNKKLSLRTAGMLWKLGENVTYEGRLVYPNNRPIGSFKDVRGYIGVSYSIWRNDIKTDVDRYNILIKKRGVGIFINPLYAVHSNIIITVPLYEMFENSILGNVNMFYNCISKKVFNKYNKDIEQHMDKYLYSKLKFKYSDDSYKVISEPLKEEGIYILYSGSEVVYIGKSKDIYKRVNCHKKDKEFNRAQSIIFKDNSLIDLYEPYLINEYKPKYNRDLVRKNTSDILPPIKLGGD